MEFFPASALQDLGEFFQALRPAEGQHLRPFAVHGIQNFARFDAKLHQAWRKFAHDEFGKILFAPWLDIPLHQ